MAVATVDEILDDLNDYSDWEEVGSVSRAKSWVTAAKRFLGLPSNQSDQGSSAGWDQARVADELKYARSWIRANETAAAGNKPGVKHLGVGSDFRI